MAKANVKHRVTGRIPLRAYQRAARVHVDSLGEVIDELKRVKGILAGAENDYDQLSINHRVDSLHGHAGELWRKVGAVGSFVRFVALLKHHRTVS